MPKYASESARTFQSAKARQALWLRGSFMSACSCGIACESQLRSSAVSQRGVGGTIGEKVEGDQAQHQRGEAFGDEKPLPSPQTEQAIQLHQGT